MATIHVVFLLLLPTLARPVTVIYDQVLQMDDKYSIMWRYDPLPSNTESQSSRTGEVGEITLEVTCKCTGYVGFGISKDGTMRGADIMIAWIDIDGIHVKDYHGLDFNGRPELDTAANAASVEESEAQDGIVNTNVPVPGGEGGGVGDVTTEDEKYQNWKMLQGFQNDTHTVVNVKRLTRTCDNQDIDITDGTHTLIYAYSSSDPSPTFLPYHGVRSRGSQPVYLIQPLPSPRDTPPDTQAITLTHNYAPVSSNNRTTHWCTLHKLARLDRKRHIIKGEEITCSRQYYLSQPLLYE